VALVVRNLVELDEHRERQVGPNHGVLGVDEVVHGPERAVGQSGRGPDIGEILVFFATKFK